MQNTKVLAKHISKESVSLKFFTGSQPEVTEPNPYIYLDSARQELQFYTKINSTERSLRIKNFSKIQPFELLIRLIMRPFY